MTSWSTSSSTAHPAGDRGEVRRPHRTPRLPPRWSFGLWLSTSFLTDYDEETVTHFVDGMQEREIPLSVVHFDCYWMKPLQWCDFEWDRDAFPDPEGMLQRLGEKGLRRSVWINPYLGQRSPLFLEAAEAGHLVRRPDGSVWQIGPLGRGHGAWWTSPTRRPGSGSPGRCEPSSTPGVDAIKTDFGERIPVDVVWHDGSDPALMHNYYSFLYNKTVFDEVVRARGEGEAVLFARSATVGGQQFPVHWGGDCESSYQSMAESLRGGLSLGLAGFGFWSHDIGGFEGTPAPPSSSGGPPSACCPPTPGCTGRSPTGCPGRSTRRRSTSPASSPS